MNDRLYHFSLRPIDFGQMFDGLCARRDSWLETAKWFRGECKDPYFMIEECSDEDEAQEIAAHYSEIIETLQAQAERQRGRKAVVLLGRPAEGATVNGWCLYVDALRGGPQPAERRDDGFRVYASERDAQEALAEGTIHRCFEFLRGTCEADGMDRGLCVVRVTLHSDGTVVDENNEFAP